MIHTISKRSISMKEAPVLFMVFNRPEKTKLVFEEIKKAKPQKLYISADGPRSHFPKDKEKTELVRSIVSQIDWDCAVKTLFHETNLGCSLAGKTAFEWVFKNEETMIQLEDDNVPSQSFFWFCQEMLERYKENPRIGYITGQNFMGIHSGDASYFFSRYGGSAGWATWKRVYTQWDYKISDFYNTVDLPSFRSNFDSAFEYKFWRAKFENYVKHGGNTYDLQSVFLVFKKDLINIIPNKNLVKNIGFDNEGSNFNGGEEKFANKPYHELDIIIHPSKIARNRKIDRAFFNYHFLNQSRFRIQSRDLIKKIYRATIKRIIKKTKSN